MTEKSAMKQLRGLRRYDKAAIEDWFNQNRDALYTFVYYRVGGDEELAADIVQETFLKALRQLQQYDPSRGSMFSWLSWLSRNCTRAAFRSEAGERGGGRRTMDEYVRLATEPMPDDIIQRKETAELVQIAIAKLPGHYKKLLKERYYNMKSLKDIAAAGSTSEGAVKAMLHRARQAFKEAFVEQSRSFYRDGTTEGVLDG